jgi:hypothetical protein
MNKRMTLAALLLLCTLLPAMGQNKPAADKDDDVVKITTNLVQVDVVVSKDGFGFWGVSEEEVKRATLATVQDRTSSKLGSTGQFVEVPDLRNNRIAMSGIVVRGTGEGVTQPAVMTTPPDRRFTLNSELYFSFFVYNASANPAVQTKLFRDGKLVSQYPQFLLTLRQTSSRVAF